VNSVAKLVALAKSSLVYQVIEPELTPPQSVAAPPDAASDGPAAEPDAAADAPPDAATDGAAAEPDAAADAPPDAATDGAAAEPDALGAEPLLELLLQPARTVIAARLAAARPRICLLPRRCIRMIWLPCRVRTCRSTTRGDIRVVDISSCTTENYKSRSSEVKTAR